MKVSNLNNLSPAQVQPVWTCVSGDLQKQYKCLGGPNKGKLINNLQDYFKRDTVEFDNENA